MNKTILFRVMLIALFLFSYQTTTIHSKHHFIEAMSECDTCEASKYFEAKQYQPVSQIITESIGIKLSEVKEKVIVKEAFDLSQIPLHALVDFAGLKHFSIQTPYTTYDATAPPYPYS